MSSVLKFFGVVFKITIFVSGIVFEPGGILVPCGFSSDLEGENELKLLFAVGLSMEGLSHSDLIDDEKTSSSRNKTPPNLIRQWQDTLPSWAGIYSF